MKNNVASLFIANAKSRPCWCHWNYVLCKMASFLALKMTLLSRTAKTPLVPRNRKSSIRSSLWNSLLSVVLFSFTTMNWVEFLIHHNHLILQKELLLLKDDNYASINSKREHPPGQPPGFCTYFQPGSRGFVPSELPGGCPGVGPIIKVPSCQLMPHEGTFQLQTDLPPIATLQLQNLFQSWGKTLKL